MTLGVWILLIFYFQGDNAGSQIMIPMKPEQNSQQFCETQGSIFIEEFPKQALPNEKAKAIYSCFFLDPELLEKALPPKI